MALTLDGTSGLSGVDGGAATPAIRGGDADTGIFYPSAGVLGISTNGSERMRIDNAGNVGVGTTSPIGSGLLTVAGSSATYNQVVAADTRSFATAVGGNIAFAGKYNTAGTYANFGLLLGGKENATDGNDAGYLGFYTKPNGSGITERMRIDSSGNVGIGTASPTAGGKLDVAGTAYFGTGDKLKLYSNNVLQNAGTLDIGTIGSAALIFNTANTERMRIDSSGNVGIGTASPSYTLDIQKSGGNIILGMTTAGTGVSGNIYFRRARGTLSAPTASDASAVLGFISYLGHDGSNYVESSRVNVSQEGTISSGVVQSVYSIGSANASGVITERMRIDSSGNVGIGTASPTQTLTVNGAVGYNAPVTNTNATYVVAATDNWIIANRAGTVTLTLPSAASFTGRIITVKNVQAQTVVSDASNVVPIGSTTAGTAILAATAGKFATLVSNGTNWVIMQSN